MTETEIKKYCYKYTPKAEFNYIRKGIAYYQMMLGDKDAVAFAIPVSDMGDATFFQEMEAKHLLRYLVKQ